MPIVKPFIAQSLLKQWSELQGYILLVESQLEIYSEFGTPIRLIFILILY